MVNSTKIDSFSTSVQHILAELGRLDLLLRVQVWRVRQARQTNENLSAFYIPEEEIDNILDEAIGSPIWAVTPLPPDLMQDIQDKMAFATAVIAEQKAAANDHKFRLRLDDLAKKFNLTVLDVDMLLIALAPEIDLRYSRLYAYLQDNVSLKMPSVNLALNLLFPFIEEKLAAHKRLTPGAPLRYHELVHLVSDPSNPNPSWLDQGLTVENRIVRYLLEGDEPDGRLVPYVRVISPTSDLADLLLPDNYADRLRSLTEQTDDLILYFQGATGVGKETTANALCRLAGKQLLLVKGAHLLKNIKPEVWPAFVRLIEREARLQEAALYWEGFDTLLAEEMTTQRQAVLDMLAARPGLTFLSGNVIWEPDDLTLNSPFIRVAFPRHSFDERMQLWQKMLPVDTAVVPDLANKFRLSAGQIHNTINTARNLARWRDPDALQIEPDDLYSASRLQSNRKLADLAQKITPHYRWQDIVLPADRLEQLREICDQVKHRGQVMNEWGFGQKLALGKGLNALFVGPPGTGKTMAADIIAHDLGLDLYKIDLSTVVSKYIGETEKNLSGIFDEAETSNAILFFDEADALFGKRTEVRDSHDRYANLEISYLLQKMEEYEGVVILATNLHKNIDDAFTRRMQFIIEFPFPAASDRRRIWEQIWPAETPRSADLDLDFVADRVVVAGGNIRNIAVAAAFLAAADGQTVTMPHLIKATQREYKKIGKLLTGKEFTVV